MQPRVVDISHHNKVTDLAATAESGVWGVIHKSSQGSGYRDPDYAPRRLLAKAAGLLWGAYHFNDGSDVATQVDWFLKCAKPDESTLLVLDFEDNPKSNMNVQQAVQFLRLIERKTGRKAAIYSGNRLKETIHALSAVDRAYVCSHRLWLCQYGPRAVLPIGFSHYWLWQYTGDGVGQPPHNVPGITAGNGGLDLNVYDGDRAKLAAEWAPRGAAVAPDADTSTHARRAAEDQVDAPAPAPAPPLADPAVTGDPELFSVQKRLKERKYSPGVVDGLWGSGTAGALAGFINDRGGRIPAPASLDAFNLVREDIKAELGRAEGDGWYRPVSEARKSGDATTVSTVAPEVVPVKRNFLVTAWGAAGTFVYGIYNSVSGYVGQAWDFFTDHKDDLPDDPSYLSTAWEYLGKVPTTFWILLAAGGLAFVALDARKGMNKIKESVQSGERQ